MLILIYSAVVPAIVLLFWIYRRDKLNPEPKKQVFRLFILGAIVPLPAALAERHLLIAKAFDPNRDGIFQILVTAFFVAGMVEEFLKAAFFQWGIYRHRDFDEPIDGVVYAAAISLGFAMIENIMYVLSFGLEVAFLRSVTAVPAHMFFGIIMGYYFARAKMGKSPLYKAYVIPAVYHGIYDSFAMLDGLWGNIALLCFLFAMLVFSLVYIRTLRRYALT